MPGAFPVCHPLYAAYYVAWHSGSSVARRNVVAPVAIMWCYAAAAAAPSVAVAAVVRVAAVAVKSRSGIVAAGRPAGALACSAR